MSNEKFQKHINQKIPFVFKDLDGNDDTFMFKPLNVNQFATLMFLADTMDKHEKNKTTIAKESMQEMMGLYTSIVKESYPDLDRELAEQFVVKNFDIFSDLMIKLSPIGTDPKKVAALKKIKEAQAKAGLNKPVDDVTIAKESSPVEPDESSK